MEGSPKVSSLFTTFPYKGMFGREPEASFSLLLGYGENEREAVIRSDADKIFMLTTGGLVQEKAKRE